jgi:hypothetical protein
MTTILVEKWRKILGLRGWNIRLREEEAPGRTEAFSEYDPLAKSAIIWAKNERGIIHEEIHFTLSPLEDAFWKTDHDKALRRLWNRRMEQIVLRLEKAFSRVMK